MDNQVKSRLKWVELYLETKDAGYVGRRGGLSRPTLRKWHRRYFQHGTKGFTSHSRRPHSSPRQKTTEHHIKYIIEFRTQRNLGARQTVRGWVNYHDISDNNRRVGGFIHKCKNHLLNWHNRRGRKHLITWEKFIRVMDKINFPHRWKIISMFQSS